MIFRRILPCISLSLIFLAMLPLSPSALSQDKDEALELYYSANALYNRKLYSLASEEYETLLRKFPDHDKSSQARMGLALCLYSLGNKKKAEPLFERLAEERTLQNQQEIHNLWGQCLLSLDRPEDAEQAFSWSATNGSDEEHRTLAMVGQIESQYRQSKWKEVVRNGARFRLNNRASPDLDRVRFQEAVAHFELGAFEESASLLGPMAEEDEDSPFMQHIFFLLAESLREMGRTSAAVQHYETAAYEMSGAFTAEALYRLGFVRFQERQYETAGKAFLDMIENHGAAPQADSARLYLGRCLLELDQFRSAEEIFDSFAPKTPEYGEARLWLARGYMRQKDLDRAESTLAEALDHSDMGPVQEELYFEHANVLMEQGEFEEAAEGFLMLIRKYPDTALASEALWLEAYCLHKNNDFEASQDRCRSFIERHPDSKRLTEVSFLKAENLFLMEKLSEANPLYRAFLSLHQGHFYAPSARFRIGQILYRQEKWQDALDALAPLIADPPEGPFFHQLSFIQGDCLFNLRKWGEAIECFTRFASGHSNAANRDAAVFKAALALEYKGDKDRAAAALQSFTRIFDDSPYLSHAYVELGRLHYEAGRYDDARQSFQQVKGGDNTPYAMYYLGYVALARGQDKKAIRHFEEFARNHPDHDLEPDALLQQGVLWIRERDYPKAEGVLGEFLKSNGRHEKADQGHFYLGVALARQEKYEAASKRFQTVLKQFDKSSLRDRSLYEWAWCEKGRGEQEAAARRYGEFLNAFPKSPLAPEVTFELAELEYGKGQYKEAASRLEALLESEPKDGLRERTLYRLGWNFFSAGESAEAAKWFETLLEEFPESAKAPVALYQAGESRLKIKEYEEAYHHFKKLYNRGEDNEYREQTLLRLGECAALTQRWQESENVYRHFARKYPKSEFLSRALFGQGWALENQERYEDAVEAYGEVLEKGQFDEISARSQFQIGECHFSLKKYNEAVKALIKVEVLYDYPQWSTKALLETGRALELMGRKDEARERYQELIDKSPDSDAAVVARRKLKDLNEGSL